MIDVKRDYSCNKKKCFWFLMNHFYINRREQIYILKPMNEQKLLYDLQPSSLVQFPKKT